MNARSGRTAIPAVAGLVLAMAAGGTAWAQLRVVTWNVTNYNDSVAGARDSAFQTCVYGVVPVGLARGGTSMAPDVFVGQEFISAGAATHFRDILNSAPGSPGDWAMAPFHVGPDTNSAFFYRTSKNVLVATKVIALGSTSTSNQPRDTMRYDIRPVGYAATGTTVGIYSVHLKAQGGTNDAGRRLIECQRIRDNAEGIDTNGAGTGLPAGYLFVVAGDFNVQHDTDPEYVELIGSQASNAGRFFDPIFSPGGWNNNCAFRWVHTQEPSTQVDDRHDQILTCAGLVDGTGFDYIGNPALSYNSLATTRNTWNIPEHSYLCWGNDGTTCNLPINTSGNTMVGDVIASALITTVAGNGHLPVFADFRVPAKVTSPTTISFGQVPLNSAASQTLTVSNAGNTALWGANGIATLSYSLAASSGFTAPGGTFTDAAGGGQNSHAITMNTSTLGIKSGTITIASNDPDQPSRIVTLTGEVVSSNQPPIANAGPDQTVNDSDGNASQSVTLDGSLSHDNDGTIVEFTWTEGASTLAQSASPTAVVTLGLGAHTIQLQVRDNANATGTDTVVINVTPRVCVADVDDGTFTGTPDGGVTLDDLLYYLAIFDSGSLAADVDDGSSTGTPDGGVTLDDLLYYLLRFDQGC